MIIITWQIVIFFILLQLAILWKYYKERKKDRALVKQSNKNYSTILSQKKSSEVRVGKIGENMAPFLYDWPYNPSTFRFLGHPVDGIQFTRDEIIFIEIKTGKSRLTKSQKLARHLVNNGKVSFATFRISENGAELIKENIEDC